MEMKYEVITPERAMELLNTSAGNPRWKNKLVDKRIVANIARDIKAGKWNPGNSSIGIHDTGELADGHHRLSAVIEADIPIYTFVCYGIPKDAQIHIDDARNRSAFQRVGCSKEEASIVSLHYKAVYGPSVTPTPDEILDFLGQYGDMIEKVVFMSSNGKKYCKNAYFAYPIFRALAFGVNEGVLSRFVYCVDTGYSNGEEESAAITIRNQLGKYPHASTAERLQMARNIEKAVSDFTSGTPRKKAYNAAIWTY